jgi:hypothetical protein
MGFLLGTALFGALAGAAFLMLMVLLVKLVFFAVTVPIRLLFGLLVFPIWILKTLFRTIGLVVLAPIGAVLGVLALGALLVVGLLTLVVPMLPLLILGLLIWLVVRSFSRRTVPAG